MQNKAEVLVRQPLGGAAGVALSALMKAEALIQWKAPECRTLHISVAFFFAVVPVGVGGLHQAAVAAGQSCGTHRGGRERGQSMAAGVHGSLPLEIFISIKCIQARAAPATRRVSRPPGIRVLGLLDRRDLRRTARTKQQLCCYFNVHRPD